MEQLLLLNGIKSSSFDDTGSMGYFTDDMLKNKVAVFAQTVLNDDGQFLTMISVKHYNDIDAQSWGMYWSEPLSPIQIYRIIQDVIDIYSKYPLDVFLNVIDDMSEQSMSSLSQLEQKNKDDVRQWIKNDIDGLVAS